MDPRLRHKNSASEFVASPYETADAEDDRDMAALCAVREFMERHGRIPTQETWTAARMTPSERTIRRRLSSFRAAADQAGLCSGDGWRQRDESLLSATMTCLGSGSHERCLVRGPRQSPTAPA